MSLCNQADLSFANSCTQVDVGFDWKKTLTYDTGGVANDVTGFVFVMTIKDENGGSTLLTLPIVGDNITTGIYIPDPTSGVLMLLITDTDSIAVGGGVYPYEIASTDTDGLISPFMQGTIQFLDRGY
jgi:hypothetical protein